MLSLYYILLYLKHIFIFFIFKKLKRTSNCITFFYYCYFSVIGIIWELALAVCKVIIIQDLCCFSLFSACSDLEFREVANRLRDWFKALHESGSQNKKTKALLRPERSSKISKFHMCPCLWYGTLFPMNHLNQTHISKCVLCLGAEQKSEHCYYFQAHS